MGSFSPSRRMGPTHKLGDVLWELGCEGLWLSAWRVGKVRWLLPGISPPDRGPKEEKGKGKKNLQSLQTLTGQPGTRAVGHTLPAPEASGLELWWGGSLRRYGKVEGQGMEWGWGQELSARNTLKSRENAFFSPRTCVGATPSLPAAF